MSDLRPSKYPLIGRKTSWSRYTWLKNRLAFTCNDNTANGLRKLIAEERMDILAKRYCDAVECDLMGVVNGEEIDIDDCPNAIILRWNIFLHLKRGGREFVCACDTEEAADLIVGILKDRYKIFSL